MVNKEKAIAATVARLLDCGIDFDPNSLVIDSNNWTVDEVQRRRDEVSSVKVQLINRGVREGDANLIGDRIIGYSLKADGENYHGGQESRWISAETARKRINGVFERICEDV